jgi:hypothetical protein
MIFTGGHPRKIFSKAWNRHKLGTGPDKEGLSFEVKFILDYILKYNVSRETPGVVVMGGRLGGTVTLIASRRRPLDVLVE